ncbi:MAG: GNAT family N-acetyltransferase [Faecalimonas sp.]|nr:GNAT family N-acetyltransferase [Faecalimonas sp.]
MKLRKLQSNEHIRTRKLWEEIFTEDTPEFLDYYYSIKIKNNEIYVIEDDGEIVSMLHLNPYEMRIGDKLFQTYYIVAVATKESHRKRGLMRQLLNYVLQVMTDREELFTFLMPADEAIYKPFGFEFVYEQNRENVPGKKCEDSTLEVVEASTEHCQMIANFANQMLQEYDVVTWRDSKYYETLLLELASEDGGILLAKRDEKIEGVFCYACIGAEDKHFVIREPIFQNKQDLQHAIYHLTGSETERVLCTGYGSGEVKPMIMAKVLNPEINLDLKNAKIFINEEV